MTRAFPEAQTANVRRAEYQRALPTERSARARYLGALERERAAGTEGFVRLLSDWFVTRSVTRSTLGTHFPDGDLADRWIEYANHVTAYVKLASGRVSPGESRASSLHRLSEYLKGEPRRDWSVLERPPRRVEPRALPEYAGAAGYLAGTLLLRKNDFVEEIQRSHAAGFSSRPRDLLEDLLPVVG